ncbi:hypothetical protein M9H77_02776 [Catharanthus roseus]|uniref:Uncharacterized protein n=1 Tax=Catharanthus roseus TaxID=4058 RepID=A0ACC0C998_CATRO|nr:hypothetical protein M9H77_02776 [Catharanthus roseus]
MRLDFGIKYLEGLKKMHEKKKSKKEEDIKEEFIKPPMDGELLGVRYHSTSNSLELISCFDLEAQAKERGNDGNQDGKKKISKFVMKKNRRNQAWTAWRVAKRFHELGKTIGKEIKGSAANLATSDPERFCDTKPSPKTPRLISSNNVLGLGIRATQEGRARSRKKREELWGETAATAQAAARAATREKEKQPQDGHNFKQQRKIIWKKRAMIYSKKLVSGGFKE